MRRTKSIYPNDLDLFLADVDLLQSLEDIEREQLAREERRRQRVREIAERATRASWWDRVCYSPRCQLLLVPVAVALIVWTAWVMAERVIKVLGR